MDLKTLVANLRRDADELEQLDKLVSGIGGMSASKTTALTGKRTLSAAARKKISLAQKARWAKARKSS